MATLSPEKRKKARKRKIAIAMISFISSLFVFPYMSYYIYELFRNGLDYKRVKIGYLESYLILLNNPDLRQLLMLFYGFYFLLLFYLFTMHLNKISRTETKEIAGSLKVPIAVGEGQFGTSRFMTEEEIEKEFTCIEYDGNRISYPNLNLGLVLGMKKEGNKEKIICLTKDRHVLLLGATRSGKSRRVIAETIWLRALCGKSMIINDPKGEMYLYLYPYLKENGYEVYTFDLNEPEKSMHFNYMQFINEAVKEGDIPLAIDCTWDLVSILVGEPKGEPLWTNGTAATIAACILIVALEADPMYRNLSNVHEFMHYMCKADMMGDMPINSYLANLPDTHPAKMVFAAGEIAPDKMRGSFFGQALTTLRLFTDWKIAEMTSKTDFDVRDIGKRKTALFIIIPDEKKARYPLASLFIGLSYIALTGVARKNGNRLPVPVDYYWDEFGNGAVIPDYGSMMSVAAGRGIRFVIVIQSYQQLEKLYKNDYENIKDNCEITVYLKSGNTKTLEELSKKTGTYTVQVNSASSQTSGKSSGSSVSNSANMQSRPVLFPDEIGRIESPYSLVFSDGKYPAIMYSPDLSNYRANKELGLGDEEHNRKIIIERSEKRVSRTILSPSLWGIWNQNNQVIEKSEEKMSFLE